MANLAIVTAADRATVSTLTSTVSRLQTELAASNAQLFMALAVNVTLATTIARMGRAPGRDRGQGRGAELADPAFFSRVGGPTARHYCWSCEDFCYHSSPRYRSKNHGHKDEATKENKMNELTHSFAVARYRSDSIKTHKQKLANNTIALNTIKSRYAYAVDTIVSNDMVIVDSGCTSHFLGINTHYITECAPGITAKLPNNMTMEATHTALKDIPHVPITARQCHIFPEMQSKALLSIAQFCDIGYHAIFTPEELILEHQADASKYFRGSRDATTRM